jgi:UDPglucose 6-dehydrogenase
MREAPSLVLIEKFLGAGAKVQAYDPVAMEEAHRRIGDTITYAKDPYGAVEGADCLVLVTEWSEFRVPDFEKIKKMLKTLVIFDGRNIYDVKEIRAKGFDYHCIGVRTV